MAIVARAALLTAVVAWHALGSAECPREEVQVEVQPQRGHEPRYKARPPGERPVGARVSGKIAIDATSLVQASVFRHEEGHHERAAERHTSNWEREEHGPKTIVWRSGVEHGGGSEVEHNPMAPSSAAFVVSSMIIDSAASAGVKLHEGVFPLRRGMPGRIAVVGAVGVAFACLGLVAVLMCCTGSKQEKAVVKQRSALPGATDGKVGRKRSMRSRLSQRSLASHRSDAPRSACGSVAGQLPGVPPWWQDRLDRTQSVQGADANPMGGARSSISVLRQGTHCQWASEENDASSARGRPGRPAPAGPERRFAVPMDSLAEVGRTGTFQVRSERGDLDMRVAIDKDGARGPRLAVYPADGDASRPMTTVEASTGDARSLEVKDSDGSSFGKLEQTSEGSYVLALNGAPLLVVDGADDTSLQMSVKTGNGQEVATVCCSLVATGRGGQEEVVELSVGPGADPTLVVTSVLSVLLLCVDDNNED